MNLMIVEDESSIRNRLATMIPWEEHGIDVVALCANGIESLRMIDRTKPDIVILDIRMPEMDGLSLARAIYQLDRRIKMIILSGYEDFEYARDAMESGVLKYLIKPASNDEILFTVMEGAALRRKEMEEQHSHDALKLKWREHLPRLQDMFFNNWITGSYSDWEIERRSKELMIRLEEKRLFSLVIMETDPLMEGEERFSELDSALLQFSLRSIAGETIAENHVGLFQDLNGSTVVLFQSADNESQGDFQLRVHFSATKVLSTFKECLKVTASAGISMVTSEKRKVPEIYHQAKAALLKRVIYGHDIAIPFNEEQQPGETVPAASITGNDLEIGIEIGDPVKSAAAIDELLENSIGKATSVDEVQVHVLYLFHTLLRIIQNKNWSIREVVGEDFHYFQHSLSLQSKEQIRICLHRIVRRMTSYALKRSQSGGHKMIQEILHLIEQEIGQELNLYGIADRYFVNKSYLSRLFKHEVGESFSQYVLKQKMIRAKRLLLEGEQVQNTAQQVGYTNVGFFSKVFHKYWGILPSEMKPS
ncbi:response regulator transcription factor [Paenibacillus sp. LPE1-1-1.1]|uniref:response regulator transcription factor n=1 Tax=Paenibacillus sp. LPE1-1-1.1 TaxID=3135230 RepID=UPI00341E2A4C